MPRVTPQQAGFIRDGFLNRPISGVLLPDVRRIFFSRAHQTPLHSSKHVKTFAVNIILNFRAEKLIGKQRREFIGWGTISLRK